MSQTINRRNFMGLTAGTAGALVLPSLAGANAGGDESRYGILGRAAPELLVTEWIDANGEPFQYQWSATKGKWVFLKCFQAWCPGCHAHGFPALKTVADAFAGHAQVEVLGLQTVFEGFGTNTSDRVREMQLRYELNIPMGHDAGEPGGLEHPITMLNYRTGGTPWIIVIDPEGQVVFNDFRIDAGKLVEHITAELA